MWIRSEDWCHFHTVHSNINNTCFCLHIRTSTFGKWPDHARTQASKHTSVQVCIHHCSQPLTSTLAHPNNLLINCDIIVVVLAVIVSSEWPFLYKAQNSIVTDNWPLFLNLCILRLHDGGSMLLCGLSDLKPRTQLGYSMWSVYQFQANSRWILTKGAN